MVRVRSSCEELIEFESKELLKEDRLNAIAGIRIDIRYFMILRI